MSALRSDCLWKWIWTRDHRLVLEPIRDSDEENNTHAFSCKIKFNVEHGKQDTIHLIDETTHHHNELNTSSATTQWVPNMGYMISCLQKNVRERNIGACMRVTWCILQSNKHAYILKLLRRIPIILPEDAILHPLYSRIVWMMLRATVDKTWIPTLDMKKMVVLMMQEIGERDVPFDRRCSTTTTEKQVEDTRIVPTSTECATLSPLLFALKVRSAFGGMAGDIRLLHNCMILWHSRFIHSSPAIIAATIPACFLRWQTRDYDCIPIPNNRFFIPPTQWSMERSDMLYKSIDFHCSDIVPQMMLKYNIPPEQEAAFQTLLWERRSSPSFRVCNCIPVCEAHTRRPQMIQENDPSWWKLVASKPRDDVNNTSMSPLDQFSHDAWFSKKKEQNITTSTLLSTSISKADSRVEIAHKHMKRVREVQSTPSISAFFSKRTKHS